MKNTLIFIGVFLGIILCILEGIVKYSDTAPLDQELGIEIISWKFFILKLIIYSLISGIIGFIISKIFLNVK